MLGPSPEIVLECCLDLIRTTVISSPSFSSGLSGTVHKAQSLGQSFVCETKNSLALLRNKINPRRLYLICVSLIAIQFSPLDCT